VAVHRGGGVASRSVGYVCRRPRVRAVLTCARSTSPKRDEPRKGYTMTTSISDDSAVHVVPRRNLPSTPPPNPGLADEKPFLGHELFRRVLPDTSAIGMAWIGARYGETVVTRSKPTPTLLLVLGGAGRLVGHSTRTVTEGDVITVPLGQEYGFDE